MRHYGLGFWLPPIQRLSAVPCWNCRQTMMPSNIPPKGRAKKACDQCRRLKVKCEGSLPCRQCRVYERRCGYDTPSRRWKPLAQHFQQLEEVHPAVSTQLPSNTATLDINDALPSKDVALTFLSYALEDACVLHRFFHKPSFYAMVDLIYATSSGPSEQTSPRSLALFFAALALGSHFAGGTDLAHESHYLSLALRLLGPVESHDVTSLQTLCFVAISLQSSGQLEWCHSCVGVALHSAIALGLHQSRNNPPGTLAYEIRKRIFWTILRLDIYSSSMLGISPLLSIDDIDQAYPEPTISDDFEQDADSLTQADAITMLVGGNAHITLTSIVPTIMKYRRDFNSMKQTSTVNLQSLVYSSGMFAIEEKLCAWLQELPRELLLGCQASARSERVGQLLHIAYAYVQMLLYEPLLGWVPQNGRDSMDPEVLQYLIRYISVARNIVSTGMSIHKAKVANFSSRSTMISTTYSAIMSLIVFLLNMPAPSGTKGAVLEEAFEGKGLLERLAPKSRLANEYLQKLKVIMGNFQNMPQSPVDLFSGLPSYHFTARPACDPETESHLRPNTIHSGSATSQDRETLFHDTTLGSQLSRAALTLPQNMSQSRYTTRSPWYPDVGNSDPISIDFPTGEAGAQIFPLEMASLSSENEAPSGPQLDTVYLELAGLESYSANLPSEIDMGILESPQALSSDQIEWLLFSSEDN